MFENFPKIRSKREALMSKRINIVSKIRSKLGIGTSGVSSLTDRVKTITSNIRGRLSSFKLGGETSPETSSMSSVPSGVAGAVPEVTNSISEYGVRGGNEVGISTIDEYGVR